MDTPHDTPRWIETLLLSNGLWLLARVLLTFLFWMTALNWIADFSQAQGAAGSVGLSPPTLWGALLIGFYLVGSVLIITDRMMWLGAGAFGVFVLLTIVMVHRFWALSGAEFAAEWNEVKEHVTVIGGLMAVCIASAARRRLARTRL